MDAQLRAQSWPVEDVNASVDACCHLMPAELLTQAPRCLHILLLLQSYQNITHIHELASKVMMTDIGPMTVHTSFCERAWSEPAVYTYRSLNCDAMPKGSSGYQWQTLCTRSFVPQDPSLSSLALVTSFP